MLSWSMRHRQLLRSGALICAAAPVASFGVRASEVFPTRTIRVVVPFTPDGGTDIVGRALVEGMQRELGQALIIDNKPSAGTTIGTDIVAKSPADG